MRPSKDGGKGEIYRTLSGIMFVPAGPSVRSYRSAPVQTSRAGLKSASPPGTETVGRQCVKWHGAGKRMQSLHVGCGGGLQSAVDARIAFALSVMLACVGPIISQLDRILHSLFGYFQGFFPPVTLSSYTFVLSDFGPVIV